jgi:3-methylfumaryl-CoA hydratase
MSRLGPDGHPERGGFMPPVPLPRRMFAGARIAWDGDLMIGEPLSRQSEILKVTEKQGSQGAMVFVTVRHVIAGAAGRLTEEQDIVYLPMPTAWRAPPPAPAPAVPDWTEVVDCTEARLFRFSALTFNAHRIHYDLAYATTVEHYPALVVHGPLQAMLVLAAAEARGAPRPDGFSFRGQRPAFHDQPLTLNGAGARVWTGAPDGSPCLVAELT